MSNDFDSASFSGCLNTVFQAEAAMGNVPLELIKITERKDSPRLENFSLIFRGPRSPVLDQRIHAMNHEKLGALSLFLVPIGPDGEGMRYEVVFNRFRNDPAV